MQGQLSSKGQDAMQLRVVAEALPLNFQTLIYRTNYCQLVTITEPKAVK